MDRSKITNPVKIPAHASHLEKPPLARIERRKLFPKFLTSDSMRRIVETHLADLLESRGFSPYMPNTWIRISGLLMYGIAFDVETTSSLRLTPFIHVLLEPCDYVYCSFSEPMHTADGHPDHSFRIRSAKEAASVAHLIRTQMLNVIFPYFDDVTTIGNLVDPAVRRRHSRFITDGYIPQMVFLYIHAPLGMKQEFLSLFPAVIAFLEETRASGAFTAHADQMFRNMTELRDNIDNLAALKSISQRNMLHTIRSMKLDSHLPAGFESTHLAP